MDFNKLTIKSGEAVAGAQELARRTGNPELTRDHLTVALLEQELPRERRAVQSTSAEHLGHPPILTPAGTRPERVNWEPGGWTSGEWWFTVGQSGK